MDDTTSAPTTPRAAPRRIDLAQLRRRFRHFRWTRPFWGCVMLTIGAYFIISPVLTSVRAMVSLGPAAINGWVVGGVMLAVALVCLILPSQRFFGGVVGMIISVASLVLTNLGGYVLGMVFGIIGSGMIFAWVPGSADDAGRHRGGDDEPRRRGRRRRAQHPVDAVEDGAA